MVWAVYFTDPTLEGTASLLCQAVSRQKPAIFKIIIDMHTLPAYTGHGRELEFVASIAG